MTRSQWWGQRRRSLRRKVMMMEECSSNVTSPFPKKAAGLNVFNSLYWNKQLNKLRFIFQRLLLGWLKCVEVIGISGSSWNLQMERLLWFRCVELECIHVHNWMNPCFWIMLHDFFDFFFTMKPSWNQFLWYDQWSIKDSNYKYPCCTFYSELVLDFILFSFLSFHSF